MTAVETKFGTLFDELVPPSGKADSLAGEIVRAVGRISYRFFNDGDHVGVGYGKETCNPAARFLIKRTPKVIGDLALALWGMVSEDGYGAVLAVLIEKTVEYIEKNPRLRTVPTEDMFSHRDPHEDVDDYEEEEYWEDDTDDILEDEEDK